MVALAGALALVATLWNIVAVPVGAKHYGLFGNSIDVQVYQAGAQAIWGDGLLYGAPVIGPMLFTYPPFSALVFSPMVPFHHMVAVIAWMVINVVALLALIAIGLRALGYRNSLLFWVLVVLAGLGVTVLEPVRTTLWLGQINLVLTLLIVADLVRRNTDSRWKGVGVGLAAGIKLTPLIFVAYLALTRQWRAMWTALGTFAATVVVGFLAMPNAAWDYWSGTVTTTSRIGRVDSPANQSVNGFFSQLAAYFEVDRFLEPYFGDTVYSAPLWLWAPVALVVLLLGFAAAYGAHRRGRHLLAVTLVGLTGCAVSPFSWGHHWVWVVPLLLIAADVAWRGATRAPRTWWRWLGPVAVVGLSFNYWYHWYDSGPWHGSDHAIALGLFMMPRWPDPQWWPMVVLYSGCYPLILAGASIATLVWCSRTAPTAEGCGDRGDQALHSDDADQVH